MGQAADCDFQSQQRVGPPCLRRLRTLHENLSREFGPALSSLLRAPADVTLAGIEQLTYGQFVYNLETPACFYLLKADHWADRPMLDIERSILHPMIDRMLGGVGAEEPSFCRPLTEIEQCLATRIVRLFLQECCRAWKSVLDLKLDILQEESNPRLLRILPADEMVLLVSFELCIGGSRGVMRLCLPCRTIERIGDKLLDAHLAAGGCSAPNSLVEVKVALAETRITAAELADLRVGDIIATETAANSPAIVSIEGVDRFRAKPGAHQGRRAVRLTEPIEENEKR